MKPLLRVLVLLLASISVAFVLAAKQAQPSARTVKRLFATVVDRAGAPLLDLNPGAFQVVEAGKPVKVTRASLVTEPMRIALIVDTSQEASKAVSMIRSALHAFVDGLPPQDEVVIMSAGRQARVRVPPTADRAALKTALDGLNSDGGGAVLLDALRESWSRFLRDAENRWPVFVAVGTDGLDNSSTNNAQLLTFIGEMQRAAANAHVVLLASSQTGTDTRAFTVLQASLNLTSYTGGHYESLAASSALPDRLKKLAEEIAAQQKQMRTQYEVDFISESVDPQARIEMYVEQDGASITLAAARPLHPY